MFLEFFLMKSFFCCCCFVKKKYATTQGLAATSASYDEPAYMVKFAEMVRVVQKIGKLS